MSPPSDTEAELVRRARHGDVEAFEAIYRGHVGRIYAVSLRMVADPALAEELTQEAFVRAWQRLRSFRGTSAFSTWLHRLAVNVVLDRLRARRRRRERFGDTLPPEPLAAGLAEPGAALDLERGIAQLPPRARAVFVLHDVEGYKHREIAELLGLSVGACKAPIRVSGSSGSVEAESVSGRIRLQGAGGRIEAVTVSGHLEIEAGAVDAVELESVSGPVHFRGRPTSGRLTVESHSGNVVLVLPADLSARFEVESFSGRIDNELGPAARRQGRYEPGLSLEFVTGDGLARVSVETFSGNIALRKQ